MGPGLILGLNRIGTQRLCSRITRLVASPCIGGVSSSNLEVFGKASKAASAMTSFYGAHVVANPAVFGTFPGSCITEAACAPTGQGQGPMAGKRDSAPSW